ncbi:hypothetical protein EJP82_10475 [Paenibacillus anaericanus]|uniref:Uncharacterized protein n=1 Tax=Paenibacillus anaericanus TaxID=170367 RepID=A0A433Y9T5_9BACL|nr:membrane lipoprotein lipid attachment site-containing protein [Paenibacillus anaericanus]RUT46664.1 hypothetical protein EJP82_10475 [Paenibacillus anaericanus]
MKRIILLLTLSIVLAGCNNSDPKESESSTNNSIPISITSDTNNQDIAKDQDTTKVQTTNESKDAVTYTSYDDAKFSLSYPSTWQSVDLATFNNPVIKYAVSNPHPKAPFADNINVVIEPNTSKAASAKAIIDGVVEYFTQYGEGAGITDYEQIDFKAKKYANYKAGILTGKYKHSTGVDVIMTQYVIPTEAEVYSITLTFSKEYYDEEGQDVIDQVIDSVKIIPSESATVTPIIDGKSSDIGDLVWNTSNIDAETNGNIQVALEYLLTSSPLSKGKQVDNERVYKAPWEYYGKALTFSGYVSIADDYPPTGDSYLQSEVVIITDDDVIVDFIGTVPSGDIKINDYVSITGLVVGRTEVDNTTGGTYTHLIVVTNNMDQ